MLVHSFSGRFAENGGASPIASNDRGIEKGNADADIYRQLVLLADHRADLDRASAEGKLAILPSNTSVEQVAAIVGVQLPSTEMARARVEQHAQELLSKTRVCVRIPASVLPQMFEAGRLKTQFETGSSRGDYAPEARSVAEERAFGIPREAGAGSRPIYGFLAEDLTHPRYQHIGEFWKGVSHYGAVTLELKDDVRPRTTFSGGDSLFEYDSQFREERRREHSGEDPNELRFAPQPITATHGAALGFDLFQMRDFLGSRSVDDLPAQHGAVEAQIHNGVQLDERATSHLPFRQSARLPGTFRFRPCKQIDLSAYPRRGVR